ncbi:hypothetical protein KI688_002266 [Linnemannia hyalina]|uniref:Uncharacterized protein n=1 Tax=Linnemannia hyalina TaxID=64524 RepID=A0A9P7XU49_9FUNG|nr:hypothetical protein KI688_002266 [Linnemannia hyalina]
MITLHNIVRSYLKEAQATSTVADLEINNLCTEGDSLTYCLSVPGSSETFTSARWALLHVCPYVLFKDIFKALLLKLLQLRHHPELDLSDFFVRNVHEDAKDHLVKHGYLPKIKDNTRLIVINDEAQFLGDHSGSGLKDSSTNFEYMEFPGVTDLESIKAYISRVRRCLLDVESRRVFDERLSQDALDMLFGKFTESIVECNNPSAWKKTIEDAEDRLDQLVEPIDSMLDLLMYQRCMFGNHDLVLKEVDPQLVEHAFGRIKIIQGHAVTVMDEPFVSKAVENYIAAIDPYFARNVRERMVKPTAIDQGCVFERFMMKVFSTTHAMMSMEHFMDAHVNHGSTRNNMSVAPFFFPKSKPSEPDLVFFIRIDGARLVPVFVQMKLHQGSSNFWEKGWNEGQAKNFRKYCPDNVYISMIVAYPTKWTEKLPAPSELPKGPSGVQKVVINISDDYFSDIFLQEHVEFIDRLKNARKRSVDDDDSNDEDCSKKQRS